MAPTSALCTLSLSKRTALQFNCSVDRLEKFTFWTLPVKNGSHSSAVCTVALQLRGQLNSVFQSDGAVGEGGDEELVPAWPKVITHTWANGSVRQVLATLCRSRYLHAEGWPDRRVAARRSGGFSWPTPPAHTAACQQSGRCWWLHHGAVGKQ